MSLKREADDESSAAEDSSASEEVAAANAAEQNPLESLEIVSMNLSECKPSEEAPSNWNRATVAEAVRGEILRSDPDIIALQECPSSPREGGNVHDWLDATFGDYNYTCIGTIRAHAGYVALLFKNALAQQATHVQVPFMVPAVMAKLFCPQQRRLLMVASCHLAPFLDSAPVRKEQVANILRASAPLPLIVAGDTNMRVEEDHVMEARLGLQDVWKLAGADPQTRFTWDTQDHRTNTSREGGGGSFNRYYGNDTRQYHSRYDRIYIHPQGIITPTVPSFTLIANTPIAPSKTHFLSDHFGIAATLNLEWQNTHTHNEIVYLDDDDDDDDDGSSEEEEVDQNKAKRQKT